MTGKFSHPFLGKRPKGKIKGKRRKETDIYSRGELAMEVGVANIVLVSAQLYIGKTVKDELQGENETILSGSP